MPSVGSSSNSDFFSVASRSIFASSDQMPSGNFGIVNTDSLEGDAGGSSSVPSSAGSSSGCLRRS